MPGRTIPPPSEGEVHIARESIMNQARAHGLTLGETTLTFIESQVEVKAQLMAEIRWLRGMIHDPSALAEFLEQRGGNV